MTHTVYNAEQIAYIHSKLRHGQKQKCAENLGIKQSALSRYLQLREGKYSMPEPVYDKIIKFINTQIDNHGKVSAT